jgi:hypothetical protein
MGVAHHDTPQGVIDWMKTAGIEAIELDGDAELFVLM